MRRSSSATATNLSRPSVAPGLQPGDLRFRRRFRMVAQIRVRRFGGGSQRRACRRARRPLAVRHSARCDRATKYCSRAAMSRICACDAVIKEGRGDLGALRSLTWRRTKVTLAMGGSTARRRYSTLLEDRRQRASGSASGTDCCDWTRCRTARRVLGVVLVTRRGDSARGSLGDSGSDGERAADGRVVGVGARASGPRAHGQARAWRAAGDDDSAAVRRARAATRERAQLRQKRRDGLPPALGGGEVRGRRLCQRSGRDLGCWVRWSVCLIGSR